MEQDFVSGFFYKHDFNKRNNISFVTFYDYSPVVINLLSLHFARVVVYYKKTTLRPLQEKLNAWQSLSMLNRTYFYEI